mgnify:CR=1 FL=1
MRAILGKFDTSQVKYTIYRQIHRDPKAQRRGWARITKGDVEVNFSMLYCVSNVSKFYPRTQLTLHHPFQSLLLSPRKTNAFRNMATAKEPQQPHVVVIG